MAPGRGVIDLDCRRKLTITVTDDEDFLISFDFPTILFGFADSLHNSTTDLVLVPAGPKTGRDFELSFIHRQFHNSRWLRHSKGKSSDKPSVGGEGNADVFDDPEMIDAPVEGGEILLGGGSARRAVSSDSTTIPRVMKVAVGKFDKI
ncbi:hypothetical protein L2E82_35532 [Cichorium intybus]|uniref:Uncharacterized protein n=1 Tax=Cichorium intybus TaxID=13427 RepID=A0ACB9BP67_CICIN|nr:hypothetical protein L2E82_35532 [Cichorium intybus]